MMKLPFQTEPRIDDLVNNNTVVSPYNSAVNKAGNSFKTIER
jgi:hypothetical protein